MIDAFNSPNRADRKPFLDKLYDFYFSFDPEKLDLQNSLEDNYKLVQVLSYDQLFMTKMVENMDYFEARFDTPEKKEQFRDSLRKKAAVRNIFSMEKSGQDIKLPKTAMTLVAANNSMIEYDLLIEANYKMAKNSTKDTMKFPFTSKMNNFYFDRQKAYDSITYSCIIATLLEYMYPTNSFQKREYAELIGKSPDEMLVVNNAYINGMNVYDLANSKIPASDNHTREREVNDLAKKMLIDAILDGDKVLEFATIDLTKPMAESVQIVKFDADYAPIKPRESYSLFRRALDTMGIWKINPNKTHEKVMARAEETKEARHQQIKAHFDGFIKSSDKKDYLGKKMQAEAKLAEPKREKIVVKEASIAAAEKKTEPARQPEVEKKIEPKTGL